MADGGHAAQPTWSMTSNRILTLFSFLNSTCMPSIAMRRKFKWHRVEYDDTILFTKISILSSFEQEHNRMYWPRQSRSNFNPTLESYLQLLLRSCWLCLMTGSLCFCTTRQIGPCCPWCRSLTWSTLFYLSDIYTHDSCCILWQLRSVTL